MKPLKLHTKGKNGIFNSKYLWVNLEFSVLLKNNKTFFNSLEDVYSKMQTSQSRPFALENECMKSKTEFLPNDSDFFFNLNQTFSMKMELLPNQICVAKRDVLS